MKNKRLWLLAACLLGNYSTTHPLTPRVENDDEEVVSIFKGSPVHEAVKRGDLPGVRKLLKANPKRVNEIDVEWRTPLHWAADSGQDKIAQYLLSLPRIKLDMKDIREESPLQVAVRAGRLQIVKMLLDKGAQYDPTILHLAAASGKTKVVVWLIDEKKIEVNALDRYENTPLHEAAKEARPETLRALLERGANPLARNKAGMKGRTPLVMAGFGEAMREKQGQERKADTEKVELLLKAAEKKAVQR